MKNKLIILIILLFSVYATAQVKTFDTPVKLNDIAEVTTVDSLLTSSSTGVINKIKYTTIFAKLLADLNAAGIAGSFDPVITNPQTGETLIYDGTNWVNSTIGGGGSETDPIFSAWDKDYADLINTPTTITAQQTADITANNAKVGITTQQAADIAANNAKVTNTDNQNAINVPFAPYLDLTETNTQEVIEQLNDKVDALSVGGSSTNLTYQSSATNGVIESSTGQNATIPAADGTIAGLFLPGHYNKLLNITATQAVDLDQMEIDVNGNNAKISADGSIATHSDVNIGSISDGQVLKWNNTNSRFEPGTDNTGGGSLSIPTDQIVYGTGSGVNSSSAFTYDGTEWNFNGAVLNTGSGLNRSLGLGTNMTLNVNWATVFGNDNTATQSTSIFGNGNNTVDNGSQLFGKSINISNGIGSFIGNNIDFSATGIQGNIVIAPKGFDYAGSGRISVITNENSVINNLFNKVIHWGWDSTIDNSGQVGLEGDGGILIGEDSNVGGTRFTQIGHKTQNEGISNTLVGYGAKVLRGSAGNATHVMTYGRGAYFKSEFMNSALVFGSGSDNVYYNNGWMHRYYDIKSSLIVNNAGIPITIHGVDAYDDVDGTDTNIAGGDLVLQGGLSTGTGNGGDVVIKVADDVATGGNVKQATKDIAVFDDTGLTVNGIISGDGSGLTNVAGGDGSETKINAGSNVTVTGTGTALNPYIINSTGGGGGSYTFNAPLSESGGAVSLDDSNYPTLNSPNSYAVNVSNTFNGTVNFNRGTTWSANYGHDWGSRMRIRWRSATNDMDWSNINGGNATGMRLGVNGLSLSAPDANFDATERLDVGGNIKASGTVELAEPTANSHATTKRYVDEMNQFNSDDFNEIIGGPIQNRTISIDDTKWATDAEVASTYNTIANFSALSLRATPYYTSATTNTLTSVSLHSHGGSNYGDNSQNATTYTIDQSTIGTAVTGGFATWVVNTATKPVVKELDGTTDGTEIDSANSLWVANTDIRIYAYYNADGVKYAFVRI